METWTLELKHTGNKRYVKRIMSSVKEKLEESGFKVRLLGEAGEIGGELLSVSSATGQDLRTFLCNIGYCKDFYVHYESDCSMEPV